MTTAIVISGFGGQGVLFAGQLLAYAGMGEGKEVTWMPSYGPEMRGGTAHCIVALSEDPIGSPLTQTPDAAIVMNNPSMDRYEPLVKPGGALVANASLVTRAPARDDLRAIAVPANTIAETAGDSRLANVVLLGSLVAIFPVLSLDSLAQALVDHLPARHRDLLEANLAALSEGSMYAAAQAAEESFA